MDQLKPPAALSFQFGNLDQEWKTWKKHFQFFLTATESDAKLDKIKTCIFLSCIGEKGREIYDSFDFDPNDENDAMKLESVLKKFDVYCTPRKNTTILRHKFFTYKQSLGKNFNEFVTQLKLLSENCEFETIRDSLIKDMIICGTHDNKLREKLLQDEALTLEKAVKLGQAAEETRKHIQEFKNESDRKIDKVQNIPASNFTKKRSVVNSCKYCSSTHERGNCPAFGKQCSKCNKKNHFAAVCWRKKANAITVDGKHNNDGNCNSSQSSDDDFEIKSININTVEKKGNDSCENSDAVNQIINDDNYSDVWKSPSTDWALNVCVNGSDVKFKLDTGAQCNILPKGVFLKLLDRPKLKSTNTNLTAYNETKINVSGKCIMTINYKNQLYKTLFIVVDSDTPPLLGLHTCERLNLIKRVYKIDEYKKSEIVAEYDDCFGDIGCLDRTHHIELREGATPIISAYRKIPIAIQGRVNEELSRMEKMGVIEKVKEPTDWLNPIVVVEKPNGAVRICLDPRNLNKVIKREHFELPTAESIMAKMENAKIFTKLDASSGYWQIKVDDESSKFLAFMTPKGRYKFNRLPFGVHSASEVFQAEIAQIINGIEGCDNMQDDIIVWGSTLEEHNSRLIETLNRIRKSGLKLNKRKCVFAAEEVTFLGHIISAGGIRPDPLKTNAIRNMPTPITKVQLQRFLGMVNYLGKFIPNLSTITAPLRELLQKDVIFDMQKSHIAAIDELKKMVSDKTTLQFYDPNLPLRMRTDASLEGLGAMLEQKHGDLWHPIAYASRSLAPAEKNYSPIEAETLSVVFGCERFHDYVYGRHFIVQNDHQPLKSIFSKPISRCPLRIQRFFLRLQRYDFVLEYSPGKTMVVTDTLSRAALSDNTPEISSSELNYYVHCVLNSLPISKTKMEKLKTETAKDNTLQTLKHYIEKGWPEKRSIDTKVSVYKNYQDELSSHDGLLLKGSRIIVPKSMQSEIKSQIHYGHFGVEKCINRARQTVFWPGISKEISDVVSNCSTCLNHRNTLQKETLIEHDVPKSPWVKVGVDLFSLYKKEYVIVVDYNSKYVEVAPLKDEHATTVIENVKKIFSRHGLPMEVFSDNGSQFTSKAFKTFSSEWDFCHDSSSPEYPKSNGFVERHIQTVKRTLKKANESKQDPYLALLFLNTTPDKDGHSPASLMFGRHPRTTLPSYKKTKSNHVVKNTNMKRHYDKRSKDLPPISPNTTVRIYSKSKHGNWTQKGKVLSQRSEPRSYNVVNRKGNILRRNRWQLLPTREEFDDVSDDEISLPSVDDGNRDDPITELVTQPAVASTPDVTDETPRANGYRTRYGRISKKPDRYGCN